MKNFSAMFVRRCLIVLWYLGFFNLILACDVRERLSFISVSHRDIQVSSDTCWKPCLLSIELLCHHYKNQLITYNREARLIGFSGSWMWNKSHLVMRVLVEGPDLCWEEEGEIPESGGIPNTGLPQPASPLVWDSEVQGRDLVLFPASSPAHSAPCHTVFLIPGPGAESAVLKQFGFRISTNS
jgi:hypothetical protein